MLKIVFPALKEWTINFNSYLAPFGLAKQKMALNFQDLYLEANVELKSR